MVYGGTIRAGSALGKPRDIISRSSRTGVPWLATITDEQRLEIVRHSCPGAGACGGHVHSKHDGRGHRGAWTVASV
jgi:dihydroxy-acid dehydratase